MSQSYNIGYSLFARLGKRKFLYNSPIIHVDEVKRLALSIEQFGPKLPWLQLTWHSTQSRDDCDSLKNHIAASSQSLITMHAFYFAVAFMRSIKDGAATTINCAVNPALNSQQCSYYSNCAPRQPSNTAMYIYNPHMHYCQAPSQALPYMPCILSAERTRKT